MIEYTVKVYKNGSKEWYLNGKRHREDGPALELADGRKEWWLNGMCHRENGPAIEWANGRKSWWVNDKLHRLDGPAIENPSGRKEWWLNDIQYSEEEFLKQTQPVKELTIAEIETLLGHRVKVIK